jgi:hypothetical protein
LFEGRSATRMWTTRLLRAVPSAGLNDNGVDSGYIREHGTPLRTLLFILTVVVISAAVRKLELAHFDLPYSDTLGSNFLLE